MKGPKATKEEKERKAMKENGGQRGIREEYNNRI